MSKSMEFKTEVSKLLDIVIHSLYSNKDIFLRELISNSSDAIDKIRYEALTDAKKYEGDTDFKIKITIDKPNNTITISDNGIGMEYDEVINTLGTIAASGTKEFMKKIEESKSADVGELIGQFGVGFYSAFMVAKKVDVLTKKALVNDAVSWSSEAQGSFVIDKAIRTSRGTDVTLHLLDEAKEYLEEWKIRELVKRYSDYIEYKIVTDVERNKIGEDGKPTDEKEIIEEVLNSQKAIWLREKSSITQDEYDEFYKHISHDYNKPFGYIHYRAEGKSEFSALLYIPQSKPFDIIYKEYKSGPMLYVKRVQIMENCEELIPPYLRFVKGVVESNDLPLNISREILQNNTQIEVIRKNITKRVLDYLKKIKADEYDRYVKFYTEFARILKEGLHYDFERREEIANLLLFESTKTDAGKFRTLEDYVMQMKTDQKDIYYILSKDRVTALTSPYIEGLIQKDIEVLIMTDDIDDIVISSLGKFKDIKFKSVVKGDIDINNDEKEKKEEKGKEFKELIDFIKDELKDDIADVKLSSRLTDSAVCLVRGEQDFDPMIEQMMKAMGEKYMKGKRTLEINPNHKLFEKMKELFATKKDDPKLKEYTSLLYDQALILEGEKPTDPAKFSKRIAMLMAESI